MQYTITDFNNIMFEGGDFTLSVTTLDIIAFIQKSVGCSSESRRKKEDDWGRFKAKPEIAIEVNIPNQIRVSLNKLSKNTYNVQRDDIMQQMNVLPSEQHHEIAALIFEIASTNKFYSNIYADLYKELVEQFPVFNTVLNDMIFKFVSNSQTAVYANPDIDYNAFCEYTEFCDKQKATALFIVNLMEKNMIEQSAVFSIIIQIQELLLLYIDEPNKINEVEELAEYLNIMLTPAFSDAKWKNSVQTISLMSPKEHKSLSNRVVFKCLDIYKRIKI